MRINEDELHRLNLKIKELEEVVYDRLEQEARIRKTKEIVLLQLMSEYEEKYLELKDKKLSNIEKRMGEAEKNPSVKKLISEIDVYKRTTAILQIELNYNKRLFQIEISKLE